MKESGHVLLGRRMETNQSFFAISRGKIIPDALKKGRFDIQADKNDTLVQSEKSNQLQGKTKTKWLIHELIVQHQSVNKLVIKRHFKGVDYMTEQKQIRLSLTDTKQQLKIEQINCKVEGVKRKAHNTPAPNVY